MNLPGFSAESSLYPTDGYYRTASAHAPLNRAVRPAQLTNSARLTNGRINQLYCKPDTWCAPDPSYPGCDICTYRDEYCNQISWHDCSDPYRLHCFPMTICNPDPLNPFCEICTEVDERCNQYSYPYCTGVKIPKKIPLKIPDPVASRMTRLK